MHCVKSVRTRSYSGPHFSRIFLHSDWIRRDTYLSRITTNTGTFHAVVTTTRISKMRQHFHKIFCLIQICQLFNSFTFSMITVSPLLTFSRRRFLSHINQSIPLESKVSKSKVSIPDSCQGSIQNSAEAFVQRCFVKKVFLENSQENTCAKDCI